MTTCVDFVILHNSGEASPDIFFLHCIQWRWPPTFVQTMQVSCDVLLVASTVSMGLDTCESDTVLVVASKVS